MKAPFGGITISNNNHYLQRRQSAHSSNSRQMTTSIRWPEDDQYMNSTPRYLAILLFSSFYSRESNTKTELRVITTTVVRNSFIPFLIKVRLETRHQHMQQAQTGQHIRVWDNHLTQINRSFLSWRSCSATFSGNELLVFPMVNQFLQKGTQSTKGNLSALRTLAHFYQAQHPQLMDSFVELYNQEIQNCKGIQWMSTYHARLPHVVFENAWRIL